MIEQYNFYLYPHTNRYIAYWLLGSFTWTDLRILLS
jgi:hypothetical protein